MQLGTLRLMSRPIFLSTFSVAVLAHLAALTGDKLVFLASQFRANIIAAGYHNLSFGISGKNSVVIADVSSEHFSFLR